MQRGAELVDRRAVPDRGHLDRRAADQPPLGFDRGTFFALPTAGKPRKGCGADVVSLCELRKALSVGVPPKKIVFNGNGKTDEEIRLGIRQDILMFNVDSCEELERIDRIALSMKKKARIAFRVNPAVKAHTHRHITTAIKTSKFGIPYTQACKAYQDAQKRTGIEIAGIHMHIGSQITATDPFVQSLKRLHPFHLFYLNISRLRFRSHGLNFPNKMIPPGDRPS